MKTLEDAIALAAMAHKGQTDRSGAPYILHPLRLMLAVTTESERMTAVLHDVVEDTAITLHDLTTEGYPEEVLQAVALLTHAPDVPYMDYVRHLAANPLARAVKMADLNDNLNLRRIPEPVEKDYQRVEKYKAAMALLLDCP